MRDRTWAEGLVLAGTLVVAALTPTAAWATGTTVPATATTRPAVTGSHPLAATRAAKADPRLSVPGVSKLLYKLTPAGITGTVSTPAAAAPVKLLFYQRTATGGWILRKTVATKLSRVTASVTKYAADVSLPYAGSWRAVALYAGTATFASASRYSDFGVDPYRLVFNSDFDGSTLDTKKWLSMPRWGREPTGDLEHYSADALKVSGGQLKVTATAQTTGTRRYTSGAICSYGLHSFTYGRFEIRAKLPKGQGLWPSFWLATNSSDFAGRAEIDIMESVGQRPNTNEMVLHYNWTSRDKWLRTWEFFTKSPDLTADFHTFRLDWTPTQLIWYQDGVVRMKRSRTDKTSTGSPAPWAAFIPNKPMFMTANLAVGGYAYPPSSNSVFPGTMTVDYIRVYQY